MLNFVGDGLILIWANCDQISGVCRTRTHMFWAFDKSRDFLPLQRCLANLDELRPTVKMLLSELDSNRPRNSNACILYRVCVH